MLNPTLKCFKDIVSMGITPVIICGNHDAEFREANDLGSAVSALKGIGCQIINTPTWVGSDSNVLCLPWTADKEDISEFASL